MIDINLLPKAKKKPMRRAGPGIDLSGFDLQNLPLMKIIIASIAFLAVFQLILLLTGAVCKLNLGLLEKSYSRIATQKKEADALKADVLSMGGKAQAIDELMVKRLSWAKKLNDLSDAMTPDVWLTDLEYGEKTVNRQLATPARIFKDEFGRERRLDTEKVTVPYIVLSGYVSSSKGEGAASIGRFIKSLKSHKGFFADMSDIELGNIKAAKVEDQDVMSFTITCFFKEAIR
ncbi:MAG: hypothetical protein JW919_04910 [Candidatus Omnitrophica bacterium]|nr:hypothetical protein [Candidatus Omnitrophota bacterium]